jgi:hypothetical protein
MLAQGQLDALHMRMLACWLRDSWHFGQRQLGMLAQGQHDALHMPFLICFVYMLCLYALLAQGQLNSLRMHVFLCA